MNATRFAAIGLFGFAVTFGLFMYDLRGIQDCVELRKRAGKIEAQLGIMRGDPSPFRDWPKPRVLTLADEVGASWIVYTAVLGSWIYLACSGSDIWNNYRCLVLVGLYVLLLLAFVKWFGPIFRGERPAASALKSSDRSVAVPLTTDCPSRRCARVPLAVLAGTSGHDGAIAEGLREVSRSSRTASLSGT